MKNLNSDTILGLPPALKKKLTVVESWKLFSLTPWLKIVQKSLRENMIYVNFVYRDYNGTLPLNNNLHQHFINRLQLASHQSAYKIPCCHGQKINL